MRYLHGKNYIHRDLKPENFLMGLGKKEGILHLIDYGLAKKSVLPSDIRAQPKLGRKFVGVARYASLNAHMGIEQGRRDDLESIGFILIYLMKGTLPWQGVEPKEGEGLERAIFRKKADTSLAELCKELPCILMADV